MIMGPQETAMTVATEERGGGTLLVKRMILVLLAAALTAAMMAVSAMPAMARNTIQDGFQDPPGPPLFSESTSFDNNGSSVKHGKAGGSCVNHFNSAGFTKSTGHGC